jgi:thermitase
VNSMHSILRIALLAIAVALLAAAPASAAGGSVIVKYKPGASATTSALPSGARVGKAVHGVGARVVSTSGSPAALAASLNARPDVEYAEVNEPMRLLATPNDPRFSQLYGLNNIGQTGGLADADIDAPEGWDVAGMGAFPATGGAKVGIVDTGILSTHEDLAGKTADCGQSVGGGITAGTCVDDNGHGTHVAGTIAGIANNARGVAGVAFNSPLGICKALSGPLGQGTTADVASCITWLTDRGARVISMSLGGGAATTLQNAVRYAAQRDVVVVAAAGNDGNATLNYPAAYAEVVSVAATDSRDVRASFSNANADVEIAAPGVSVMSTYNDGGYRALSGTSMATPHVAGVTAVIRTRSPTSTAAQARSKLDASVDDKGAAGRDTSYGFGRVNLVKAAS